jgi:hypothetical protein
MAGKASIKAPLYLFAAPDNDLLRTPYRNAVSQKLYIQNSSAEAYLKHICLHEDG